MSLGYMRLMICVAMVLIGEGFVWAGADPAAQQLLVTAEKQAALFNDNPTPIRLDASFVSQQAVPVEGRLTLIWASKDRWWRKVTLKDFVQIEIRNGDKLYIARNLPFTPVFVSEVTNLLQFAHSPEDMVVKKQKQQIENNIAVTCMEVKIGSGKEKPHEICVTTDSHDLLSNDWKTPPDEWGRQQFSDYFDFDSHRYPRKLELLENGSKVTTVQVENLVATTLDDALLVPPKGAIERRQCEGMKHPVPVSTPDPAYPRSARENQMMGDTRVSMTVLADGSITNIQLIGSSAHSMDEAALETLRKWKFKPATCGSEPVVSDIQVFVSFRLY